jgi:hypothetical protein
VLARQLWKQQKKEKGNLMRNAALMTVGVVAALGAAFAVPALSDGPANYRSGADTTSSSAYTLHEEDHPEYVVRQTDGDTLSRETTVRDERYGYEEGVAQGNFDRDRYAAATTTRDGTTTVTLAEESIEVQARRLPNGAPVAVRGMVTTVSGKHMVLQRGNTTVHARLPGMIEEIRGGDDVTVYGRLANRGNDIAVRTDAVLLMTGIDEGRLFLAPSKLESVNKRNAPITRAAARNALDYYRYNFTPL